jgi:uncharacterized protein YgbK (DUF1537 family)
VVIIADDLTGACDTGIAFAPDAAVVLREPAPDVGTLIYSTDSRSDTAEAAAAKVAAIASRLPAGALVYKKVDSVLRGNIFAEVAALGRRRAVACTAFPEQGRVVRGGIAEPPGVALARVVPEWVEVRDAESSGELDAIAEEALGRGDTPLLVGSAGLARAVARRMGPGAREEYCFAAGSAVVVIGSTHEVTRAQAERLKRDGGKFTLLEVDMAAPRPDEIRAAIEGKREGGVIVSGGDTALLVCRMIGARAIRLRHEWRPGIPVGEIVGGFADGLPVITKSGGFGAEDALSCAVRYLSGDNQ